MKFIECNTHKRIQFNEKDKVVCIGYFFNQRLTEKTLLEMGAKEIWVIPSLIEEIALYSDRSELLKKLMQYDYHLVAGRADKETFNRYEAISDKGSNNEPNIINVKEIRCMDLSDGTFFKVSDGKVLRGCLIKAIPSIIDRITRM